MPGDTPPASSLPISHIIQHQKVSRTKKLKYVIETVYEHFAQTKKGFFKYNSPALLIYILSNVIILDTLHIKNIYEIITIYMNQVIMYIVCNYITYSKKLYQPIKILLFLMLQQDITIWLQNIDLVSMDRQVAANVHNIAIGSLIDLGTFFGEMFLSYSVQIF